MRVAVLDTSCVRGAPRAQLFALADAGFDVQVSGLALNELLVHFSQRAPDPQQREKRRDRLRRRMAFFLEWHDGAVRLAPTHAPLLNKLGGSMRSETGIPTIPFAGWLKNQQTIWQSLVDGPPYTAEIDEAIESQASYVEETGEDFLATTDLAGQLGVPSEHERRAMRSLWRDWGSITDSMLLPKHVNPAERFDAYDQVQRIHAEWSAERRSGKKRPFRENHAIDTNILQHLADGSFLVTQDFELIELVDASGSLQAPWVRSMAEMLFSRLPKGKPFGMHARKALRSHRVRRRSRLKDLDSQLQGKQSPAER